MKNDNIITDIIQIKELIIYCKCLQRNHLVYNVYTANGLV